jgi:hypothetical protein
VKGIVLVDAQVSCQAGAKSLAYCVVTLVLYCTTRRSSTAVVPPRSPTSCYGTFARYQSTLLLS